MLATLEVQKAIYEVLTVFGLPVYSSLPLNTPMPYVQFTGIQVMDSSNKLTERQTYIVSLTAWCQDSSAMTIHQMVSDILELVEEELDLGEQYSHDNTTLNFLRMFQDELNTELIHQAVIDLKITVSEN